MKNKIKVLECIRQGQIGGGESHLLSLIENLDRTRFDPVVLSFTDGPMVTKFKEMNIPVHVIHTTVPFDVRQWGAVKRFIKSHNVDLVHAHGTRANSNVLWASRSLGLPVIYTVHGWSFHPDQNVIVRNIRVLGEKYLASNSALNISVSASNQETGRKYIPSFKSEIVNNGIDQQKFNPGRTFPDIRQELGISPADTLIIFIARFTSHKQPLLLLDAFDKAARDNKNLHLLMVGDGDQKAEGDRIHQTLASKDKITMLSFRQDVPALLAAADIFVLPSLWEGLPIGLLEAMAMGKSVIATNVDGTREIVRDGENGLLIASGDVDQLSKAILRMADDKQLRARTSEKAIETVAHGFNAAAMTKKIEELYLRVLKN